MDVGLIGNRLVFVILLDLELLVLAAPLADPIHKLPDRFDHYPIESVNVQQFAEFGLSDLAELQKHPNEVSISLREVLDLHQ